MRKVIFFLLFALSFKSILAQETLPKNQTACALCSMSIKDELHAAQIVDRDEHIFFGSIECLMNFLAAHPEEQHQQFFVADYFKNGRFINAKEAFYLQTSKIKSPMGANLSAFSSKTAAEKASALEDDRIYDWKKLKEKFAGPATGAIMHDHFRPDAYAPIGVMGDHLHHKGSLMFSFTFMGMQMNGMQQGTEKLDNADVFENYMMVPQEMNMKMYMLGAMYAPTNHLTFMFMQNYFVKDMDAKMKMLMNGLPVYTDFSTASSGWGDLSLEALYGVLNIAHSSLHLNAGLNFPVGNIDERDDTPMAENSKLPYPMQLSSGTFDVLLGTTFKQTFEKASWGTQFLATLRTGENDNDYRLGNVYKLNTWAAYRLLKQVSFSGRAEAAIIDPIKGADPELNPMMSPTANPKNTGAEIVKTFVGFNFTFTQNSTLKNLRFGAEAGLPVYANYDGLQMKEDLSFNLGLKYSLL